MKRLIRVFLAGQYNFTKEVTGTNTQIQQRYGIGNTIVFNGESHTIEALTIEN